jgi:hypothetical protein
MEMEPYSNWTVIRLFPMPCSFGNSPTHDPVVAKVI